MTNTANKSIEQKPYLTPREAAELLGLSERTLRDHRRRGSGPAFAVIGGVYRYRRLDIDAFVQAHVRRGSILHAAEVQSDAVDPCEVR